MRFVELATASERLAATSKRSEKSAILADLLQAMSPDEVAVAVGMLTGWPRQGRIGVGWSTLSKLDAGAADEPTLDILGVDRLAQRARSSVRTRLDGDAPGDAPVDVRRRHAGRAPAALGRLRRRASPGRARRRHGRRDREGKRRADRRGPAGAHAVGGPRRDRSSGVCGRRRRAARGHVAAGPGRRADAGVARR